MLLNVSCRGSQHRTYISPPVPAGQIKQCEISSYAVILGGLRLLVWTLFTAIFLKRSIKRGPTEMDSIGETRAQKSASRLANGTNWSAQGASTCNGQCACFQDHVPTPPSVLFTQCFAPDFKRNFILLVLRASLVHGTFFKYKALLQQRKFPLQNCDESFHNTTTFV